MKQKGRFSAEKKKSKSKTGLVLVIVLACVLAGLVAFALWMSTGEKATDPGPVNETTEPIQTQPPETTEPAPQWETGFVSAMTGEVSWCDESGASLGTLTRGTQVEYIPGEDRTQIRANEIVGYLQDGAVVADAAQVIPAHTLYVRTAVNLRDAEGKLLVPFANKGQALEIIGYDRLLEDGSAHMYRVSMDSEEGYVMPWYLADNEEDALANYDNGSYETHVKRGDRYGGGDAAELDYYPRQKGQIPGNDMPEECRTLYIAAWRLGAVDSYINLAKDTGINAFVVDIADGGSIGYASEVMQKYSPSAAKAAKYTVEEYQAGIQKLKDAGYYVIGRITTFNDTYLIKDHPEYAITDNNGNPLKLSKEYWPTAFNRIAWQYKVDLAVEAVELMGFNEIQFDYVRFPDKTRTYENAGTIDFHNTYGESKAQAIQRFLMYATDILHEKGVYVSADVYGESAYTYVTAYGQYWPAITNVVDVISGMPYPDHFAGTDTWKPWEHPYETLNDWGKQVMKRQAEAATPGAVRTWIQAYNAIKEPHNTYGAKEIAAQIKGLRDAGCTGGYMTWNSGSSLDKYKSIASAFAPPEGE